MNVHDCQGNLVISPDQTGYLPFTCSFCKEGLELTPHAHTSFYHHILPCFNFVCYVYIVMLLGNKIRYLKEEYLEELW